MLNATRWTVSVVCVSTGGINHLLVTLSEYGGVAMQWRTRAAAIGLLIGFIVLLAFEHALERQLSPGRHMVSEYANASSGALMVIGFSAWATSLAVSALAVRRRVAVALGLALAAMGMCLVASFHTQAVRGRLPDGVSYSSGGRLHDLGGELVLIGLLVAWLADALAIRRKRRLRSGEVWLLLLAVVMTIGLLAAGDPLPGLRQRVLIIAGAIWQLMLFCREEQPASRALVAQYGREHDDTAAERRASEG